MPMEPVRINRRFSGDRITLHKELMAAFADEAPGEGNKELTSRYIYIVEKTPSGHEVELSRPAILNKGIDFIIRVPTILLNNKRSPWPTIPSHEELRVLLAGLKSTYPRRYKLISDDVRRVYQCEEPSNLDVLATMTHSLVSTDEKGIPADVVVLIAKWQFAEQDLTYWNNSGRGMLFSSLEENGLV